MGVTQHTALAGAGQGGRRFSKITAALAGFRAAAERCVGHEPEDAPEDAAPSVPPARPWAWQDAGHRSQHRGAARHGVPRPDDAQRTPLQQRCCGWAGTERKASSAGPRRCEFLMPLPGLLCGSVQKR